MTSPKTAHSKPYTYWQTNLRYLASLLAIWFIVSYGCGILFVEQLNRIRIGGLASHPKASGR